MLAKDYKDTTVTLLRTDQAAQIAADFLLDGIPMLDAERVYIIDPLGNLMMFYPPEADPSGMLKDLRKLLKYSKIG
jgi:hypothetical protein